jgi:hypothetical protein
MTKEQFDKFLKYIDVRIDEKMEEYNGRDSSFEYLKRYEIENELANMLITEESIDKKIEDLKSAFSGHSHHSHTRYGGS